MKRTPPPKRKLEDDFGESDSNPRLNDSGLAKKLNMSIEARKDLSLFGNRLNRLVNKITVYLYLVIL